MEFQHYSYNKYISIVVLFILFFLYACGHDHNTADGHDHDHSHEPVSTHETETEDDHSSHDHAHTEHKEGEIGMTQSQIKTVGLEFGDFSQIKINDVVKATGTLGLPPNALTAVSAKASGFIKNSKKYIEGSYIKKGAIMAYVENPDFIEKQQKYLEVKAGLLYDHQELDRQKKLLEANAGIERNVQELQSKIAVKNATLKGLAKQLSYIGIPVDKITPENIIQQTPLYAPMSGYITSIQMHNGMFVTPSMELMEIVNENHLHLELDVFEKDISKIKEKQTITYTVPALGNQTFEGEIHVIGKKFNPEQKTVRVHGHLGKDRPKFIKDLFLEANIWLTDQTVQALPESAIVKDGSSHFIYYTLSDTTAGEVVFEAARVVTGISQNGFTAVQVIDELPSDAAIVRKGAYYVYAQSKSGELEHSH